MIEDLRGKDSRDRAQEVKEQVEKLRLKIRKELKFAKLKWDSKVIKLKRNKLRVLGLRQGIEGLRGEGKDPGGYEEDD